MRLLLPRLWRDHRNDVHFLWLNFFKQQFPMALSQTNESDKNNILQKSRTFFGYFGHFMNSRIFASLNKFRTGKF